MPDCTWNLTSLAVFTYFAQSRATSMTLDRTPVIGMSWKRVTSLPCKIQKWRNFNTRSLTFVDWSWNLISAWKVLDFSFHKLFISNWNFFLAFSKAAKNDQPDFKRSKPSETLSKLDTTALGVRKRTPQKTGPPKPSLCRLVSKTTKGNGWWKAYQR